MPYPVKVQPIDFGVDEDLPRRKFEPVAKPVLLKARFKRLFERRNSEKPAERESSEEFEPSSICLARMVQNYMEESNDKPLQKCGRNRCNCFNGSDSSDDDSSSADACVLLKVVFCVFICVCLCLSYCMLNRRSNRPILNF